MAIIRASILTTDLLTEPNLKHLLKKMGKNDRIVAAQADRPTCEAMSIKRGKVNPQGD